MSEHVNPPLTGTNERGFLLDRFLLGASLLLALGACGCDRLLQSKLRNASPDKAVRVIGENLDLCAKHLPLGAPRDKVMAFLPRPHNTNNENVCIWIVGYTKYAKAKGRRDWQWLELTESGYFLIFADGKLATGICSNAAFDAWQALESYANITRERCEQILGARPR